MSNTDKESFNVADLDAALNAEGRADLVSVLKNKLQDLAGKHSDVLENLAPSVRKRVDVLREIQTQHDDLEAKFLEERAALEAKYQKLYHPHYVKRYEIVNGGVEVGGGTADTEPTKYVDKAGEEKGVPDFWLTAMKNNEVLAEEISERDEGALKFLQDIKWSRLDNPKGFKLEFYFDTNPFFKNSVLTKAYHMIDEDEPILEKAIGSNDINVKRVENDHEHTRTLRVAKGHPRSVLKHVGQRVKILRQCRKSTGQLGILTGSLEIKWAASGLSGRLVSHSVRGLQGSAVVKLEANTSGQVHEQRLAGGGVNSGGFRAATGKGKKSRIWSGFWLENFQNIG